MIIKIKLFWCWVKRNWKLTALALWSAFVWLISRRSSAAAIKAMEANKKSYETQIRVLKEQHKIERQKVEELNLKYRQAIVTIEEKYNKKEKELSRKEKKIVKEIIKKAKDNPDEINNKIEELFGFTSGS